MSELSGERDIHTYNIHTGRNRRCEGDMRMGSERDGKERERRRAGQGRHMGFRAGGCNGVTEKTAGVRMAKRGKVEGCDLRGLDRSRLRQNRAA